MGKFCDVSAQHPLSLLWIGAPHLLCKKKKVHPPNVHVLLMELTPSPELSSSKKGMQLSLANQSITSCWPEGLVVG